MKAELKVTTDYSIFEMHPCNRPLNEKPDLESSLRRHGFMPSGAIHVAPGGGGKFRVIRGHHRLHYAKRIKLPVYYIVDDSKADIFDLEGDTTATWSMKDFVAARTSSGDKECARLLAFKQKHNLPIGIAASLVAGESAGSHNAQALVKRGRFKAGDQEHAEKVVRVTDELSALGVDFAVSGLFVQAVSKALRVPEFDVDLFLSKVRLYPMNMHRRTTAGEYLEEMESLYNYQAKSQKNRIPLLFRAKEVSLKRKASFGKES